MLDNDGLLVKDGGETRTERHVLVMLRDEVVPKISLAVAYLASNDSHGKATSALMIRTQTTAQIWGRRRPGFIPVASFVKDVVVNPFSPQDQ